MTVGMSPLAQGSVPGAGRAAVEERVEKGTNDGERAPSVRATHMTAVAVSNPAALPPARGRLRQANVPAPEPGDTGECQSTPPYFSARLRNASAPPSSR